MPDRIDPVSALVTLCGEVAESIGHVVNVGGNGVPGIDGCVLQHFTAAGENEEKYCGTCDCGDSITHLDRCPLRVENWESLVLPRGTKGWGLALSLPMVPLSLGRSTPWLFARSLSDFQRVAGLPTPRVTVLALLAQGEFLLL